MRDKNTMDKQEYIGEVISWNVVLMLIYNKLLFINIPVLDIFISKALLWSIVILNGIIGINLSIKKRRNNLSVFINVVFPYGAYISLVKIFSPSKWIIAILICAGVLTIMYSCFVMSGRLDGGYCKKDLQQKRKRYALLGARTIFGFGMGVILLSTVFQHTLNYIPIAKASEEIQGNVDIQYTIKDNINIIGNLEQEKWKDLNLREKMDVCQMVLNIEVSYLGLPYPLTVKAAVLEEGMMGYYNNEKRLIIIDLEHLKNDDSSEILDTLLHECYHSYQYRLVEIYKSANKEDKKLLLFYDASLYEKELENYISGDEDFISYYTQWLELDARRYGREGVQEYFEKIEEYTD